MLFYSQDAFHANEASSFQNKAHLSIYFYNEEKMHRHTNKSSDFAASSGAADKANLNSPTILKIFFLGNCIRAKLDVNCIICQVQGLNLLASSK